MGTMGKTESVASALFGKTRRAVLGLLYAHPDEAFHHRQVMRRTGAGKGAVQRELRRLSDAGILTRSVRGREVYYQADRQAAGAPSKITREDLRLICFDVVSGG